MIDSLATVSLRATDAEKRGKSANQDTKANRVNRRIRDSSANGHAMV